METAFFWILWGVISFWALKTFYFSFSKEKVNHLRKTAIGLNLAVFILTFLPWLSVSLGGKSGFILALEGNMLALLFVVLLIISTVLFLTKESLFLKTASAATIVNSFLIFIIMYQLRPDTFVLTFYDIAPIIVVLLLLVCNVVVLLLWQQLQLKKDKRKRR